MGLEPVCVPLLCRFYWKPMVNKGKLQVIIMKWRMLFRQKVWFFFGSDTCGRKPPKGQPWGFGSSFGTTNDSLDYVTSPLMWTGFCIYLPCSHSFPRDSVRWTFCPDIRAIPVVDPGKDNAISFHHFLLISIISILSPVDHQHYQNFPVIRPNSTFQPEHTV